jgi:hypothetical protein
MARATLPTPDELRQLLRYEQDTGKLYWLPRPASMFEKPLRANNWNSRYADREAFTALNEDGYHHGKVAGKMVRAHRVVWAMVFNAWPDGEVDHINGDRTDNRLENLRLASRLSNGQNQKRFVTNTSGYTGVSYHKRSKRWQASVHFEGRSRTLGYFDSPEAAAEARAQANRDLGFHPNHGQR